MLVYSLAESLEDLQCSELSSIPWTFWMQCSYSSQALSRK
jgi:hypothetical protein